MISMSSSDFEEYLNWICAIQQIPAPTFLEQNRAVFIQAEFNRLGMENVHRDETGNVLGFWPGGQKKPVLISAHLDTVHTEQGSLPLDRTAARISGPGVADNSTGLAALLSLAHYLATNKPQLPGGVWLAANVCEEGLGDLSGMRTLTDRFTDQVVAYLALEGLGLGQVCHRGLGVSRFKVIAETAGGHSWVDYGAPSAIHELAKVVTRVTGIPLAPRPRSSLNVGIIEGGTSINTIASHAFFLLDIRSEEQNTLVKLCEKVRKSVITQQIPGVKFSLEQIGMRPAGEILPDHPLVTLALDVLRQLNQKSALEIGSTDANIPLSRGFPAICVGLTRGGFPHTAREYIEIEPLKIGFAQLVMLIERVWQID